MAIDHPAAYWRERLLRYREDLLAGIKEIGERLQVPLKESIGELSLYDNNPADIGSETFERSKDLALKDELKLQLRAVERALERIESGNYGICEECGQPIAPERLEAVPYATLCLNCQKKEETRPRPSRRPIEEEVMEEVCHASFDRQGENVMYDMEDTWQEVARYSEHAEEAGSGAYFGDNELVIEDRGYVEEVENIPYEIGDDGVIYENRRGFDDERLPFELIDVGRKHSEFEVNRPRKEKPRKGKLPNEL